MRPPRIIWIVAAVAVLAAGASYWLRTDGVDDGGAAGSTAGQARPAHRSDNRSDNRSGTLAGDGPRSPGGTEPPATTAGRAFDCSIEDFADSRDETLSDEEQLAREQAKFYALIDRLAESTDLDHRLMAGILKVNGDFPDAIDEFERLLPAMPEHPILHWRLLDACAVRPTHPLCADGEAERRTISILGANGEAWAKIAPYRLRRGDERGALEALGNAATAAEFEDYWSAETALLFGSLASGPNSGITDRLLEAIGYTAAFPMPQLSLIQQCRSRAGSSPDWYRVCLAYGQRKETDTQTLLGKGIGVGLQRALYELIGDTQNAQAAEARAGPVEYSLRDPQLRDGEVLLAYDESIALAWLQHMVVYGQLSAQDFLKAEVDRVRRIPGYDPCPEPVPQM